MGLDLAHLFFIGIGYLLILFGIAFLSEQDWVPQAVISHPVTYILSLGVFGSAWSYYGAIEMAYHYGHGVLSYYMGTAALFLFAPLVLMPIIRITRLYQLGSLPDLLAFRYRSKIAGTLSSCLMLLSVIPLIALQIQAVSDTLHILSHDLPTMHDINDQKQQLQASAQSRIAFVFCIIIAFFTILFGSRREQHRGLVVAVAFESLVKTLAFIIVGLYATYYVLGDYGGIDNWLAQNPDMLQALKQPKGNFSVHTLLLIFFSAAIAMPHLFHMGFSETPHPRAILASTWGMPLFLLIFSLPIFPILWAGSALESTLSREYYTLAIGLETNSVWLTIVAFVGGLSAASGAIIIITIALANICINHIILPIYQPSHDKDIYSWLLWMKRVMITFIILSSYFFWDTLGDRHSLATLAIVSFIGALQFFPGILAMLYWPRANRQGFIVGISVGASIWAIFLLIPMLIGTHAPELPFYDQHLELTIPFYDKPIILNQSMWGITAIISLATNIICFFAISLLTTTDDEELHTAKACAINSMNRPARRELDVKSAKEFKQQLAITLGKVTAVQEVDRALKDLHMKDSERRPYALRRLRDQIEANLSGLMGPSIANQIVNQYLPYKETPLSSGQDDIYFIENQLTKYRNYLTGLAGELNNLRLYHQQTLQDLPLAACSLGNDNEILMWNQSMTQLTGISSEDVTGSNLNALNEPWRSVIGNFIRNKDSHLYKQKFEHSNKTQWVNLHRSFIGTKSSLHNDGQVILLEDLTEMQLLENELAHSERLASVGRLAAGVAHEIGNPITGIACLAQNLHYDTDNPELHKIANQIIEQTERVTKIVQSLVNFSHAGNRNTGHDFGPVDISQCAQEAINLLSLKKDAKDVSFKNSLTDNLTVSGDSQRLLQVFVNLISNALDASPQDGNIIIDGDIDKLDNSRIVITVLDEGSGIPSDLQSDIFEPFYTTKDPGKGTGLGLSLVYRFIQDHNGQINVTSPVSTTKNTGTKFTIWLPRYPKRGSYDTVSNITANPENDS